MVYVRFKYPRSSHLRINTTTLVPSYNVQRMPSRNTEVRLIPAKLKTMDLPAWLQSLILMLLRRCFVVNTPRVHTSSWPLTTRTSFVNCLQIINYFLILTFLQIWDNMNKSDAELAHKRLIGIIWLVTVCFFNTVPLLVISFLANLDSVCIP